MLWDPPHIKTLQGIMLFPNIYMKSYDKSHFIILITYINNCRSIVISNSLQVLYVIFRKY
jgi:hypothetical protein